MKLSNTQLFRGIEEPKIESLIGCFETKEIAFKKGEYVLKEGNPTEYIGIVLSGAVIIELSDVWGNNSVISRIGVGGTFAEAFACIPGEPMTVNVLCAEDSTVLLVSMRCISHPCSRTCAAHTKLIQNLLSLCAEKNLRLSKRMLHIMPKSIRQRLLSLFSEYIKKTDSFSFDIPYSRQQLADYLNVERSALCNELSKMQKDGIIKYEKNHFVVDDSEVF